MTVKLDAAALDSAITAVEDLASAIDFYRNWCTKDSPVELASLADHNPQRELGRRDR